MINAPQDDKAFDEQMRATLQSLPVPASTSIHLPRRNFLRTGLAAAAGLLTLGVGGFVGVSYAETPKLVRDAFAHRSEESGLRGILIPDMPDALAALDIPTGKSLPGVLQLCKSCEINGYPAWHFKVYLDQLGYVDVFAFRKPLPVSGQGQWLKGHWAILSEKRVFPLMLISKNPQALSEVLRPLQA